MRRVRMPSSFVRVGPGSTLAGCRSFPLRGRNSWDSDAPIGRPSLENWGSMEITSDERQSFLHGNTPVQSVSAHPAPMGRRVIAQDLSWSLVLLLPLQAEESVSVSDGNRMGQDSI